MTPWRKLGRPTGGAGYHPGMASAAKRRVSVTLDADLGSLAALLDRLASERGALDTPEDEAAIERFMTLLGGAADESQSGD